MTITDLINESPIGDPWRRADGSRPTHSPRLPFHHQTARSAQRSGGRAALRVRSNAAPEMARFDDWDAMVAFDYRDVRRCKRLGLRELLMPAGRLADGVRVFVRNTDDAPRGRK